MPTTGINRHNKGEHDELLERRLEVLRLRAQNVGFREIGEKLGISAATAYKDVAIAREYWKERAAVHFEEHIAVILSDLDILKSEAYKAWISSVGKQTTTTETTGKGSRKRTVRTTHEAGDPRFLVVVERCIDLQLRAVTGLKGDGARGKSLAEFLAIGRSTKKATFLERERTVIIEPDTTEPEQAEPQQQKDGVST